MEGIEEDWGWEDAALLKIEVEGAACVCEVAAGVLKREEVEKRDDIEDC